jgi:hypothetical protein
MQSRHQTVSHHARAASAARFHGFLIERGDGVYHLGGTRPACLMALARTMVEGGWLVKHGPRYEPTARGLQAVEVSLSVTA